MMDYANNIDAVQIANSIELIKKYIDEKSVQSVIVVLEELQQDPSNKNLLTQLIDKLDNIGVAKGAVLTYAPYINLIISDDPFSMI